MSFELSKSEDAVVEKAKQTDDGWFICKVKLPGSNHLIVQARSPESPLIITAGSLLHGLPREEELDPNLVRNIRKTFTKIIAETV